MASRGTIEMSSNSRIDTTLCPAGSDCSLRSSSNCMTMAVDDRANPNPATSAAYQASPASMAAPVRSAPQVRTWIAPRPKISRLRLHSRAGRISSPMMNRNSTMPISATCSMVSGSDTTPSTDGPKTRPAAR